MGYPDVKTTNPQLSSQSDGRSSGTGSGSNERLASPTETTPALLVRPLSQISTHTTPVYKVYRRRFFGLAQLSLLNVVVSWDWISFAAVSKTSAQYFNTKETSINWISTSFLFAFVVATPFTFYALSKHGPKTSIITAACLLLVGNWIRYAGTRATSLAGVMVGQLLIGLAQPFVLSAPTSYSNVWFSAAGRTTATAVASLANPFGAALGQLIDPFWANSPSDIPNMVLYISIISTVAAIPSFFIPAKPPTPPSAGATSTHLTQTNTIRQDLHSLFTSVEFYLLFAPFSIYVGFFNSFSSLLNQILEPYSFSESDAGIAGALLIVVGLISAAISSPFIDKYKFYLSYIKVAVPIIAFSYLLFIWAPQSRGLAYPYVICSILGAASFGLVPVALEFLVEIHHPLGPEVGSTVCWSGGQLLGGIFIIVQNALKAGEDGKPQYNMKRALVFQAVLAMVAMPLPLALGMFGRGKMVRRKRWEEDLRRHEGGEFVVDEVY